MQKIMEKDLFEPINSYLLAQGYSVYSEVKNCDVIAKKNDEIIIIELKKNFNLKLITQAINRQKITDSVYVAIPKPKSIYSKSWSDTIHLLKRLQLGLIVVSFLKSKTSVEVIFHPSKYEKRKNNKAIKNIIREIGGRSANYNVGGVTKEKIMTAYREIAIYIACCFEKFGPLSPKELRKLGTGDKTQSILSKNFYGWYENVKRGVYTLHKEGFKALESYSDTADYYRKKLEDIDKENKIYEV